MPCGVVLKVERLNKYYLRRPHHGWGQGARMAKMHSKFHYYVHEKVKIQAVKYIFFQKKIMTCLLVNKTKILQIIFSKFSQTKANGSEDRKKYEVISDFYEI